MTLKKELIVSVVSFLIKGGCALYINYLIINYLSFEDFGSWAVLFSVAVLLSVADFGIGQYLLTNFVSRSLTHEKKTSMFSNSFFLIIIICIVLSIVFLGGYLFIDSDFHPISIFALYFIVLYRIAVIPYGAYIQSLGKYYERKLIEAVAYILSLFFVSIAITSNFSLIQLLIGMNVFISFSSAVIYFRAKQLNAPAVSLKHLSLLEFKLISKESLPYFINNTSGLLIYGVFISVSSLFLEPMQLAKLALMHSIIFTNLYQGFELVFRTLQTKLNDSKLFRKLVLAVCISFIFWIIFSYVFGQFMLKNFFPTYQFTSIDIFLYSVYMFLEFFYLLYTSKIQMMHSLSRLLLKVSLLKLAFFLVLSLILVMYSPVEFAAYLIALICFSITLSLAFIVLFIKENSENLVAMQ